MFYGKDMGRIVSRFLFCLLFFLSLFVRAKPALAASESKQIADKRVVMNVSDSKELKIDGVSYSDKDVVWSSSDKSVATISKLGKVKAKRPGYVKIKAVIRPNKTFRRDKKIVRYFEVKIRKPKLNVTKKRLAFGKSFLLRLKYADAVHFSTSNSEVVLVDDGGCVKAVGAGAAIVTCKDNHNVTYQCQIDVSPCKHKWSGGAKQTLPDCSVDGNTTYLCSICGYEDVTVIPALGHDYDTETVEPSKEGAGYTKYHCKRCGESKVDNIIDYNPTDQMVREEIIKHSGEYYEGKYWTNANFYPWSAGVFEGGYGCVALCFILSDHAFGYLPAYVSMDFDNVRIGDIIRMSNDTHSVMVIDRKGDYVTVVEGNVDSSIHWGRQFSVKVNSKGWDYIISRYPKSAEVASDAA